MSFLLLLHEMQEQRQLYHLIYMKSKLNPIAFLRNWRTWN